MLKSSFADQAQSPVRYILGTADIIDNAEIRDVVVKGIGGKITTPDVIMNFTVDIIAQDAPGLIVMFFVQFTVRRPERSHLDDLPSEMYVCKPETPSDQAAVAKQLADFLRGCIRGHVEILGMSSQHQVAHGTANQAGLVTRLVQSVKHLECGLVDIAARNAVF
jgi:hypothetical protein